jgi:hypothetical protein
MRRTLQEFGVKKCEKRLKRVSLRGIQGTLLQERRAGKRPVSFGGSGVGEFPRGLCVHSQGLNLRRDFKVNFPPFAKVEVPVIVNFLFATAPSPVAVTCGD